MLKHLVPPHQAHGHNPPAGHNPYCHCTARHCTCALYYLMLTCLLLNNLLDSYSSLMFYNQHTSGGFFVNTICILCLFYLLIFLCVAFPGLHCRQVVLRPRSHIAPILLSTSIEKCRHQNLYTTSKSNMYCISVCPGRDTHPLWFFLRFLSFLLPPVPPPPTFFCTLQHISTSVFLHEVDLHNVPVLFGDDLESRVYFNFLTLRYKWGQK